MLRWSIKEGTGNVTNDKNKFTFKYPCESHENCFPYSVNFYPGVYQFECYGGIGGSSSGISGGKAGITKGVLFLKNKQTLFLSVGATGLKNSRNPTFGGGGKGSQRDSTDGEGGGSGGGASDVRLFENDLYSRIMVAAGGGGSENYGTGSASQLPGGDAGGISGSQGTKVGSISPGLGGTQYEGGSSTISKGNFGFGGNASSLTYGSGGGGGYYGGGGGSVSDGTVSSGGGGSSYIIGYPECPINNSFSMYKFYLPQMITGYEGDTQIIVTIISPFKSYTEQSPLTRRLFFIFIYILVIKYIPCCM